MRRSSLVKSQSLTGELDIHRLELVEGTIELQLDCVSYQEMKKTISSKFYNPICVRRCTETLVLTPSPIPIRKLTKQIHLRSPV